MMKLSGKSSVVDFDMSAQVGAKNDPVDIKIAPDISLKVVFKITPSTGAYDGMLRDDSMNQELFSSGAEEVKNDFDETDIWNLQNVVRDLDQEN